MWSAGVQLWRGGAGVELCPVGATQEGLRATNEQLCTQLQGTQLTGSLTLRRENQLTITRLKDAHRRIMLAWALPASATLDARADADWMQEPP